MTACRASPKRSAGSSRACSAPAIERYVRKLGYIRANKAGATHTVVPGSLLAQINDLEEKMQALSDEELRGLTPKFRERLANGETLDRPAARGVRRLPGGRPAAPRTCGTSTCRSLGGVVLHRGNIAEMVTGEGKTLVATLPAYLNALEGKGVHVITVNDYLARRDCEWMLPIYRALGITAGYIQSDMDPVANAARPTTATSPTAPTASSASTTCATT